MVNFPSRPNLRPVDPPPLGASVRHPLSLPHPGIRPRTGRGQFEISNLRLKSPSYRWPSARTIKAESRQKPQQSRLIKPYQGKRQKTNITIPSANGAAPYQPRATSWVWPPHDTSPERASQPSIKAKTPAIKAHQALSRQIKPSAAKWKSPHGCAVPICHAPLPPSLDVGRSMLDVSANQVSSRLIVPHQGKTPKNSNSIMPSARHPNLCDSAPSRLCVKIRPPVA